MPESGANIARTDPAVALQELSETVRAAASARMSLRIVGSDSKQKWWRTRAVSRLDMRPYRGIVAYEPSELVLTARTGTPLAEIESTLAASGQMLGFEPPHTGPDATLGGAIAAGFAGPARPYRGGVRDFMLGVSLLNDAGEVLKFGGRVMKNVAGYDVSRLVSGAWGRLGPLLEVSLSVVPAPAITTSIAWRCEAGEALARATEFARQPYPITALAYDGVELHMRLAGAERAVAASIAKLQPPLRNDEANDWANDWAYWRDFSHPHFSSAETLWRVVVPPATPLLTIPGFTWWDWGGALRWVRSNAAAEAIQTAVGRVGGHASCWSEPRATGGQVDPLGALEIRVRQSFDPLNLFNPSMES